MLKNGSSNGCPAAAGAAASSAAGGGASAGGAALAAAERGKEGRSNKDRAASASANQSGSCGELQQIKIVILGATRSGKTSLVQQFVSCSCPEVYTHTRKPVVYHPAIAVNDHSYEARVIDCPSIRYFPANSLQEFSDFRGYGLRSASGFVLVYDVTAESSFAYVRQLRDQMHEIGIDAPILVAANKMDLLDREAKDKGKEARREVSNMIKKQWKCMYVECSAKYNWHVSTVFKELLKAIDHKDFGHKPTSARVQEAFRRNQCCMM